MIQAKPKPTDTAFRRLLGLPDRPIERVEKEMNGKPHLNGDRRHVRRLAKLRMIDARQAKDAEAAIGGRLPDPDEAFHLAVSGRFSLWDVVPAALEIAGCSIEALTIATLGFSKRNVTALCNLIDQGSIGTARLNLARDYFSQTSKPIFAYAVEEFAKRADRMTFVSLRTHAKILLFAFADGRRLTVESSANLRSCKNIEQCTLVGDPALFDFHAGWTGELLDGQKDR